MATWRAEGEEGALGHVKGHLWGFVGPPHDGRGSASGGSNFSKPWGGAVGLDCVCLCHKLVFIFAVCCVFFVCEIFVCVRKPISLTVIASNTTGNTTQIVTVSHPQLMIM